MAALAAGKHRVVEALAGESLSAELRVAGEGRSAVLCQRDACGSGCLPTH